MNIILLNIMIIFNNLIENSYIDILLIDIEIKQKIWNIFSKFPKNIFTNNTVKQLGEENIIFLKKYLMLKKLILG